MNKQQLKARQKLLEDFWELQSLIVRNKSNLGPTPNNHQFVRSISSKQELWFCLYFLNGRMPNVDTVEEGWSDLQILGIDNFLRKVLESVNIGFRETLVPKILIGQQLVDVNHTLQTGVTSGIQRVVRETVSRLGNEWKNVRWNSDFSQLSLTNQFENSLITNPSNYSFVQQNPNEFIIPVKCIFLLPELATEHSRTSHLRAMAKFTNNKCFAIAYDCVPIMSSETTAGGMPTAFARYLAMLQEFEAIFPISHSAENEFIGWTKALTANTKSTPSITTKLLGNNIQKSNSELKSANERSKNVVVLGSHEPRKNHLAILRAAEKLWIDDYDFELSFFGGSSWNSSLFKSRSEQLRNYGYPVHIFQSASDQEVQAKIQNARFTIFPSLNEGYGLPVAESILLGTPVITSDFGSMKEISEGKGALLVDPRSEEALYCAMRNLLIDDEQLNQLIADTKYADFPSWEDYVTELTRHCGM